MAIRRRSGAEQQIDRRLQPACLGALSTLTVQFLLGMGVNLFVKVPDSHPGARPAEYFSGSVQSVVWAMGSGMWLLVLHIVIGLLLLGSAIGVAWSAFASRGVVLRAWSVLGALGVVAAGFNGASYLDYHEDLSSMLMSAGFALALIAYSAMLFIAGRQLSLPQ